ncbi:MAG: DUF362 domain-containing protein [Thermincola sp.]|jgi:uncharacterized Fe-S center protein|nr:DUF362 domain-containing protein [Thermincola sp.]MDT3702289.1 DUF362 domain-containing protein [Thermincola sp.]
MAKVYYSSARATDFEYNVSMPAKLEEMLSRVNLQNFVAKGDYVAIKMHFGSYGAVRIVRPAFIRKIVEAVKALGGQPFVADTVRIPGLEYLEVANANGINHLSVGAPVILADGLFGKDVVNVPTGGLLGEIGIAGGIYEAQSMIVVTHCKGHGAAGYGGAVKNLAMGGIAARNKDGLPERGRMHFALDTHLEWNAHECTMCEQCVAVCPHQAINFDDRQIYLDQGRCAKCARCAKVCPSGALIAPISAEVFQRTLAEAAKAVIGTFKPGKILYINFITEVQPECDCMPLADVPIVQDQGILVSDDIVAVDMATLDMIGRAAPLPGSRGSETPGGEDHIFQRITGRDPYLSIRAAGELGLGETEYDLIEIDRKSGTAKRLFTPSSDRIPLKPKGHGWHRESEHNPHPCGG